MTEIGPVMLDVKGLELDAEEKEMIAHPACGGVILFARNLQEPDQILALNRSIEAIKPGVLLAVDQEGGRVQRLKSGFTNLPALRRLHQEHLKDEELKQRAQSHATVMAKESMAVGFDISFTPVLDLCSTTSRVIGDRAFHENPNEIERMARWYIEAMTDCGMAATGKHFPGHGTVEADSHFEIPIDSRCWQTIETQDLLPFTRLCHLLAGIMPAHVVYSEVDPLPAGFSPFWIKDVLRKRLAFDGVVFSDDLSMKGAEVVGDYWQRAQAALSAGCDMVLVCNHPQEAGRLLEQLGRPMSSDSRRRLAAMKSKSRLKNGLAALRDDPVYLQALNKLGESALI